MRRFCFSGWNVTSGRCVQDYRYASVSDSFGLICILTPTLFPAASNGAFAYTALLGCIFSPKKFGSSVLLLAAIQDVFWFFLIITAGGYTIGETIGLRNAIERMSKKKDELEQEREGREREKDQQPQYRDEKQSYEREREKETQGYGATGHTGGGGRQGQGASAGSGGGAGGGFGGSGFGTGVQAHGGVGSGGHERFSGVGTGIEGEFGSHGGSKTRGAQGRQ
jgi:hypothetical protein